MKSAFLFVIASCLASFSGLSQTPTPVQVTLTTFASGLAQPNGIYSAGDGRLFILEKDLARIRVFSSTGTLIGTFLDVNAIASSGGERGLLGMAFHPNYTSNGYFYINYTNNSGHTVVARYTVSANPDVADAGSALILLTVNQPFSNHNGGHIAFGPDGYLYVGMGDGGSANDPLDSGQTGSTLLGKMLRIDVDNPSGGNNYGIPADNPFLGDPGTLDEVWATGLRNPWKFSFDSQTGDLWIGDVGQNAWEEIDFQPASSTGGENYGWRCYEGFVPTPSLGTPCNDLPEEVVTFPVAVLEHGDPLFVCSVTGGFVYRGSEYPGLQGVYVFSDYCTGRFYGLIPDGVGGWDFQILRNIGDFGMVAFAENETQELFVANIADGVVYRIGEQCGSFDPTINSNGDGSLSASAGTGYWWYQDGVQIPGANAANYTPTSSGTYYALIDNGTCIRQSNSLPWLVNSGLPGCTYPQASNYDPDAETDDGSCEFIVGTDCPTDLNGDNLTNTADLVIMLATFGSNCP